MDVKLNPPLARRAANCVVYLSEGLLDRLTMIHGVKRPLIIKEQTLSVIYWQTKTLYQCDYGLLAFVLQSLHGNTLWYINQKSLQYVVGSVFLVDVRVIQ